jgi:pyruvate kinase
MLSAETSVGQNPDFAVATMARIIETTENAGDVQIPPIEVSCRWRPDQ